jgi:hypothetical protein
MIKNNKSINIFFSIINLGPSRLKYNVIWSKRKHHIVKSNASKNLATIKSVSLFIESIFAIYLKLIPIINKMHPVQSK